MTIELAATLQSGLTPDVALLERLGKTLPIELRRPYREMIVVLRVVRGLTRAPGDTAGRLAFAQRLEAAARGTPASGFAAEWDGLADRFRTLGPIAADLLQAAQRELAMSASGQTALFAGWSDFYNHARFSLAPIGRGLLQGTGSAGRNDALEALMTALALTAALQEAPDRFRRQHVLGFPAQWLTAEGASAAALEGRRATPALRKAYSRGVDRVHELLSIAARGPVPPALARYVGAVTLVLQRLARRLQRSDPLAGPIALSMTDRLLLRLKHGI
jgi:hypothetical protein